MKKRRATNLQAPQRLRLFDCGRALRASPAGGGTPGGGTAVGGLGPVGSGGGGGASSRYGSGHGAGSTEGSSRKERDSYGAPHARRLAVARKPPHGDAFGSGGKTAAVSSTSGWSSPRGAGAPPKGPGSKEEEVRAELMPDRLHPSAAGIEAVLKCVAYAMATWPDR